MKALLSLWSAMWLATASSLFLLAAVVPASHAVVVAGLYDVEFPVPDQSSKVRNAVFAKGLEEVLIRVSGNRSILEEVKPAAAATYVQRFSYAEQLESDAGKEPAAGDYTLQVQYNAAKIISLLRSNAQPVWGEHRSEAVVWIAVRDGTNRYVLKDSDQSLLKEALGQSASRRGLPVIWPANDPRDQQQLSFVDLWATFAEPIKAASRRYSTGPAIVGRLSWTGSEWRSDWSLFIASSSHSWALRASDYGSLVSEAVDLAADKIGQYYAVLERTDTTASDLLVEVNNIDSLQSYRKIQNFLDNLAAVRQTSLVRLDGDVAVFRIDLRGDVNDFVKLVAIDKKLEPVRESIQGGVVPQQQTMLRYSYRQ